MTPNESDALFLLWQFPLKDEVFSFFLPEEDATEVGTD